MPSFGSNDHTDGDNLPARQPSKFEIVEKRCNVCKSKWRRAIDQMIVLGVPYAEIARNFEHDGLTRRSISNHRKRHLTAEHAAVRQIIEETTNRMIQDVENTKQVLLTKEGYMKVALVKSYQAIVDGSIVPEPRDVVRMIELMDKMEREVNSFKVDEVMRDFQYLIKAIKNIVPGDMFTVLVNEFKRLKDEGDVSDMLLPPGSIAPEDIL